MAENREAFGSEVIRRPIVKGLGGTSDEDEKIEAKRDLSEAEEEDEGVNWEDKLLEETLPLVGFARMILHSGRYRSGYQLTPEHERTIIEKLLPYHPKKIRCGIDSIMVGYHLDFKCSRGVLILRTDGWLVDFSCWKCIKGLIRKKYPLYADSFILRHFGSQDPTMEDSSSLHFPTVN